MTGTRVAQATRVSASSAAVVAVLLGAAACAGDAGEPRTEGDVGTPEPDAVRPFRIQVADEVLSDLRARLERTRLPDEIPGTAWEYGTSRAYLEELLAYWRDEYDWRAAERRLNELDQFVTTIDGLDVHFVHQRSTDPDAVPLLLVHGWPGSFVEFADIVGPLADPAGHGAPGRVAFHVVAPSLPGFGFSDAPREPGWGPERMADLLASLMERLGYERYGLQGGDWGAIINRSHAGNYADRVIGLHTNFLTGGPPPGVEDPNEGVPQVELELRAERVEAFAEESAYQDIQGTKPQSLGYALNDSPAGLAAWIAEKFHGWTDHEGHPEQAVGRDALLTNVTLYWVTGTITSSMRIYYESRHTAASRPVRYVSVPTAAAIFPKEIYFTPRRWAEARFELVRWTMMPRGGHFAALEEPDLLVEDVRAFFESLR